MNYLQSSIKTIPSYEVAEMMEKKHKEVLKMIHGTSDREGIIQHLTEVQMDLSKFFIESTYVDNTGKSNKCYECTKMGCELLAHKMTGKKGTLFSARYVEKFNALEQGAQNIETLVMNCLEKVLPSMIGTVMEKLVPMLNPPVQEVKVDKGKEEFAKRLDEIEYNFKTATVIANFYSLEAHVLNQKLKDLGFIVFIKGNGWFFAPEYENKEYGIVMGGQYGKYIKYSNKGCYKIYELLKEIGILPNWEGDR